VVRTDRVGVLIHDHELPDSSVHRGREGWHLGLQRGRVSNGLTSRAQRSHDDAGGRPVGTRRPPKVVGTPRKEQMER
jgi:hypothetical protein